MGSLLSKNQSNRDEQSCASPYFKSEHGKGGEANYRLHKLKSNILLQDGRDFKIIISMPRIEYRLDCDNFTFIKTLSWANIQEYQKVLFQNWHMIVIKQLMSYEKFHKQILEVSFRQDIGLG